MSILKGSGTESWALLSALREEKNMRGSIEKAFEVSVAGLGSEFPAANSEIHVVHVGYKG